METYVLGADPGQTGAATVVVFRAGEKPTIVSWVSWNPCAGGYKIVTGTNNGIDVKKFSSIHEVAEWYKHFVSPGTKAVVEGLFEGGYGKRVKKGSGVKCAEAAGELIGPLRERISSLSRPKATGVGGWRRDVLGLPDATKADRAEELAVAFAAREIAWPEHLSPYGAKRAVTLPLAVEGAVAEAACMALHQSKTK